MKSYPLANLSHEYFIESLKTVMRNRKLSEQQKNLVMRDLFNKYHALQRRAYNASRTATTKRRIQTKKRMRSNTN